MTTALTTDAPTLELCDAAVRRAGSSLGPALSLRTSAARVGLVGAWQPLFQVLTGQAELASGSARVFGCAWGTAIERGVLGFAACDPLLPPSFTVTHYLQHAARLTHGSRTRAARDTKFAIDRYGLASIAARKLSELTPYQRRALGIALATLTTPAVVCLETPLYGLDAASANYVSQLCVEAARHCRIIVSATQPSFIGPERSLLDTCDELFLLEGGALTAHGAPARVFAARERYSFTVTGSNSAAFSSALREAGCELEPHNANGSYNLELPPNTSTDLLLDTALAHDMVVLELEPTFGNVRTLP